MRALSNGTADRGLPGRSDSQSAATSGTRNVVSHQADGHAEGLKDDARSLLNNALQVLELEGPNWLSPTTVRSLQEILTQARYAYDAERAERREIVQMALVRTVAPDPAHLDALAEMEKTNRELGLRGDALLAHLETEALDSAHCAECGKEFFPSSATDRLCTRCYVENKL